MDSDGSNDGLLTNYDFSEKNWRADADWSPDGRLIAYSERDRGSGRCTLGQVIDAAGLVVGYVQILAPAEEQCPRDRQMSDAAHRPRTRMTRRSCHGQNPTLTVNQKERNGG